jgi:glycosyltransferase involved in cell wall biosynthesis
MPTVSIIVPTYNSSAYIYETIDSLLAQTFKDYEIIIVDDGSTDDTQEKLKIYGDKIKYIYQSNQGPSVARNNGITLAVGKYIAFLDSDDLWLSEKLELQVNFMENNPDYGLVSCDALAFKDNQIIVQSMSKERPLKSGWVLEDLLKENFLNTNNVLIRRDVFNTLGMFDINIVFSEDYEMWLRIAEKYMIGYVDLILTKYRLHSTNRSEVNKEKQYESHSKIVQKYIERNRSDINKRNVLSYMHYKRAYNYFYEESYLKSSKYFGLSIIYNPFVFRSYIFLVLSILPDKIIDSIRRTVRKQTVINKNFTIY